MGHFVLGHSGKYFTELCGKSDSVKEREANIFSAFLLMPDIVLLAKIFYRKDSFQKVKSDLVVSQEALIYRLINLFNHYFFNKESKIKDVVYNYYYGFNQKILLYFEKVRKSIIKEYKETKCNIYDKVLQILLLDGCVTSDQVPELLDNQFRKELENRLPYVQTWLGYSFRERIGYAWVTNQMTK